ncbi:MAG TPA: ankyrin repeat domain-containing protein [Saprospiraceae bacterium]|nr:ankyrin repeat domain-containing protein [Saprospiraceae bacterium]
MKKILKKIRSLFKTQTLNETDKKEHALSNRHKERIAQIKQQEALSEKFMRQSEKSQRKGQKEDVTNSSEKISGICNLIRLKDLNGFKKLLEEGADLNSKDENDNIPLWVALSNELSSNGDYIEFIQLLLKYKANVNIKEETNGNNPLALAAFYNRKDIVNLLIEHGADINIADKIGARPIFAAIKKNNVEICNILLSKGADPNVKTFKYGDTPLIVAAMEGHLEIVKLLIENKADINIITNYGDTAIYHAVIKNNIDVIILLIKNKANINPSNKNECSPLYTSCLEGNYEIAKILLENGALPNSIGYVEKTPLSAAAHQGNIEVLNLLLYYGAKPDINPNDLSELSYAVQENHFEVAKSLLKHGADFLYKPKLGLSAMDFVTNNPTPNSIDLLANYVGEEKVIEIMTNELIYIGDKFGYVGKPREFTNFNENIHGSIQNYYEKIFSVEMPMLFDSDNFNSRARRLGQSIWAIGGPRLLHYVLEIIHQKIGLESARLVKEGWNDLIN